MAIIKINIISITFIIIVTGGCAQSKQTILPMFTPNHSVEDIVEQKDSLQKIQIDSLYIVNPNIDSVLSHIFDDVLQGKIIWAHLYLVFEKINDKTYLEILADYSNRQLFINKGFYYKYKLYGYLNFRNKFIYVSAHNISKEELDLYLGKTKIKSSIKITTVDHSLDVMKLENPMWLYEFKYNNVELIKSLNNDFEGN